MSGERRLIVNADDFGRSPGINRAIIDCYTRGIVTSTTLMVNLPWTGEAVALWRAHPGIGLGLHLNFCYGEPVSSAGNIRSLVESGGRFVTDTAWLREHADGQDVATETRAQIELFVELTGRLPTHLDSHKYLHSASRIRSGVIEVAAEYGLAMRSTTADDRKAIRGAGLSTTDHFEGRFHGHDGDGVTPDILSLALEELQPGLTELMCHPGYVDEHIRDSSYALDREREIEVLTSADISRLVERLAIRLTNFARM